jgi:tetratricopeptide (TPR) repeat protein
MGGNSSVSLAMIVRNAEASLPNCLSSTRGLFDETVVVDTGSEDGTRDVARSFGAIVEDFEWREDFSAARNAALSRCGCDFIFWLDADEVLTRTARSRLARLMKEGLDVSSMYTTYWRSNRPDGAFGFAEAFSTRLFPNGRGISWTGRVCEGLLPRGQYNDLKPRFIDLYVDHLGFAQPATLLEKLGRNIRLLGMERVERPEDLRVLFNLALAHYHVGRCRSSLGEFAASRRYLEELLGTDRQRVGKELERSAYTLLARIHFDLENVERSLELCELWRNLHPTDLGLTSFEPFLMRQLGMWERAESLYDRLPGIKELILLRENGHAGYFSLLRARIEAAYFFEEVDKYSKALQVWYELFKHSAGMFDAVPGLRRASRHVLRKAVTSPGAFLDEVRRSRRHTADGLSPTGSTRSWP